MTWRETILARASDRLAVRAGDIVEPQSTTRQKETAQMHASAPFLFRELRDPGF
jgi:hypothetical protein